MRAWVACFTALAVLIVWAVPTGAQTPTQTPEALQALSVMDRSCSDSTQRLRKRLPEIKTLLGHAGRRSILLAQETPSPAESPVPETTSTNAPPAGNPGGTPLPGVSPTPYLQRPPIGPGVIPPPTLPPASATPAPPGTPTPSPSPEGVPTGPIPITRPTGPPPTVAPKGVTPTPFPTSSPTPGPSPTIAPLQPGQILIISDSFSGSTNENKPQDFDGNVNLFYDQGEIVADHAHYDGTRYLDFTGHPYLRNYKGDTVMYAQSIRFDKVTQEATLMNGNGETTEGVERGELYFKAHQMLSHRDGNTTGTAAYWTTCENPHGGYHMESKSFELRPNDKLIFRKVTVFLGPLAIFYLPVLIIGLRHTSGPPRTSFLPLFGYDQPEGFWVKSRIGFGTSPYLYGYYRIEYFSKLGFGLGGSAVIATHNHHRQTSIDFYRSPPKPNGGNNNFSLNDQEQFSSKLRAQVQTQYVSNYGPLVVGQPPSLTIGGSFGYTGTRTNDQFTFQRYSQGTQQGALNLGYTETLNFRSNLTEALNLGMTRNYNSLAGFSSSIGSAQVQSLLNYTTPWALYSMNYQKTISQQPSGKDIVPEFQIQPRAIFPYDRTVPVTAQFILGEYTEPQTGFSTARDETSLNFGPALAHVWGSDFSASLRVRQDVYGTGDAKAEIDQLATLTTPLGNHLLNAVTYNETNSNGPQAEPFQTFDILSGGSHSAQDVLQFYNRDVYVLRLSTGTSFNRQAQPISYSFTLRPSRRSYFSANGSWNPGPGQGFYTTQYQIITPFGYKTDLQFAATQNWKMKGAITDKVVYLRKIIGDCYDIRISYNQDLKLVSIGFDLLAFPSYGVNFGLGQVGSIVPGNLTGSF
jgi:hypothetical protein